jgi:uncharacterized protein (DUF305 family)
MIGTHMRVRRLLGPLVLAALVTALAVGCGSTSKVSSPANAADSAFVQQMIPHHEMAVQMAQSAQIRGQHSQIKTLASSIIVAQSREIAEMKPIAQRLTVVPDQMPSGGMSAHMGGDASALGLSMDQMGMSMNMSSLNTARPFDPAFIDMMIPHHQGAIRMARAELAKGINPQLRTIATGIIAAQAKEIGQLNAWRTSWYGQASSAGGVPTA